MPYSYAPDMGGYYHAMDRGYEKKEAGMIPIRELGIPTAPFSNQLEGLKSKIFQGASKVELGFSGRGKGSMQGQNTTPEMYGKDEREAIRELAAMNKIELSTHASFSIGSLSGLGERGFDEGQRKTTLDEIRRTIEFAADTARGGAIVVHTQEFPRIIADEYKEFALHPKEAAEGKLHFINQRTGDIKLVVPKDDLVPVTIMKRDPRTGKELDEPEMDKNEKPIIESWDWERFKKETEKESERTGKKVEPITFYYDKRLQSQINQAKGWAHYHEKELRQIESNIKLIPMQVQENIEKLNNIVENPNINPAVKEEFKKRLDYLQKNQDAEIAKLTDQANVDKQRALNTMTSYHQQVLQAEQEKKDIVPIKQYGLDKTAQTVAEAAIYAWQLDSSNADRGLKPKDTKPLFIAPENLFPEQYGSHPEELRDVILTSRAKMRELLKDQFKVSESEAKKLADDHIKATLDTGHAYMWKKFFNAKIDERTGKMETPKQTEDRFDDWVVDEIGKLAKAGIIGHVHMHDNFGYYDEHVTPGQGKVPLKRIMEKLRAPDVRDKVDIIVEPAHQDYKAMLGAWREFGHSIYGMSAPGMPYDRWTDLEHMSYFGKTAPPYFVVGDFRPSEEWTLWSQTPME